MASVNRVILIGNTGRDPELRYAPNGSAVCNFPIATTTEWKDKATGEKKKETEWHRIVTYNKLAEIAGEYLKKGREVYIEGRLKTRKWQDKETGADRYSTEIIADQMQMLGPRNTEQSGNAPEQRTQHSAPMARPKPAAPAASLSDMDDSYPF